MTTKYDQLLDIVRGRRSIRRFSPDPVEPGAIDKLIEAARWAPSASNRQPWRFLVLSSKQHIGQLAAIVTAECHALRARARPDTAQALDSYLGYFAHFADAPVVIVPLMRTGLDLLAEAANAPTSSATSRRAHDEAAASVSAAIMNLLLAAHALGLGACWMTGPLIAADAIASNLPVPPGWEIAALIPVGHAAEVPEPPPRRPLERIRKPV